MTDRKVPHNVPAVAAAIIIPLVAIIVILFVAKDRSEGNIDYLEKYATPELASPTCANFFQRLPRSIAGFTPFDIRNHNKHRWISQEKQTGDIFISCGVEKPASLTPTSQLQQYNSVSYYTEPSLSDDNGKAGLVWIAVDRPVYIAIWIPASAANGPLAELTDIIAHLPKVDPSQH